MKNSLEVEDISHRICRFCIVELSLTQKFNMVLEFIQVLLDCSLLCHLGQALDVYLGEIHYLTS